MLHLSFYLTIDYCSSSSSNIRHLNRTHGILVGYGPFVEYLRYKSHVENEYMPPLLLKIRTNVYISVGFDVTFFPYRILDTLIISIIVLCQKEIFYNIYIYIYILTIIRYFIKHSHTICNAF